MLSVDATSNSALGHDRVRPVDDPGQPAGGHQKIAGMEIAMADHERTGRRPVAPQPAQHRLQSIELCAGHAVLERPEIAFELDRGVAARAGLLVERGEQRPRLQRVQAELRVDQDAGHAHPLGIDQHPPREPLHQQKWRAERNGVGRRGQHLRRRIALAGHRILNGALTQDTGTRVAVRRHDPQHERAGEERRGVTQPDGVDRRVEAAAERRRRLGEAELAHTE